MRRPARRQRRPPTRCRHRKLKPSPQTARIPSSTSSTHHATGATALAAQGKAHQSHSQFDIIRLTRFEYPPTPQSPPVPLQQARRTSSQTSREPTITSTASLTANQLSPSPSPSQSQARSQIEAMPPTMAPPSAFAPPPGPILQPRLSNTPLSQHYDSSIRHPVFFSPTLRKPPFPLPYAASGGVNPVAQGYVVENGGNAARGVRTKL